MIPHVVVCRTCRKEYPHGTSRCPADGTALVAFGGGRVAVTGTDFGTSYTDETKLDTRYALEEHEWPEELPSGALVGEYEIEGVIGRGGMGTVYAARHPLIGKKAAVKVISRELSANPLTVDRFVLEARSVNQIGDPNIVDVFAFGTLSDGRSYFVMERLMGENLAQAMRRERMQFTRVLDVVDQVARALQSTHEAGIVHRDLKPDNVFLCAAKEGESGMVKLLDFGVAKLIGEGGEARVEHTRAGMIVGTPLYISPEQASAAPTDARTDIYALGVITYELLCGRPPFAAETAVQVMAMHISAPVVPPSALWPGIPPQLDALIVGMLEKHPDHRPTLAQVRATVA